MQTSQELAKPLICTFTLFQYRNFAAELFCAVCGGAQDQVNAIFNAFAVVIAQVGEQVLVGEGDGIHWPDLDEDLSVAGLLKGGH